MMMILSFPGVFWSSCGCWGWGCGSRGQDHFKQSSSRLHFIADRVVPWAALSSPKVLQHRYYVTGMNWDTFRKLDRIATNGFFEKQVTPSKFHTLDCPCLHVRDLKGRNKDHRHQASLSTMMTICWGDPQLSMARMILFMGPWLHNNSHEPGSCGRKKHLGGRVKWRLKGRKFNYKELVFVVTVLTGFWKVQLDTFFSQVGSITI